MDTATSALSAEGTAAAAAAANDASLALKVLFNNHLDLELPVRLSKFIREAIITMAPSLADTTDEKLAELALRVLTLERRKDEDGDEIRMSPSAQAKIDELTGKVNSHMLSNQKLDGLSKQVTEATSRMRVFEEHLNTLTFNVTGVDHQLHDMDDHMHHVEVENHILKEDLRTMSEHVAIVEAENQSLKSSFVKIDSQMREVDEHMHQVAKNKMYAQQSHVHDVEDSTKQQFEVASQQNTEAAEETAMMAGVVTVASVNLAASFSDVGMETRKLVNPTVDPVVPSEPKISVAGGLLAGALHKKGHFDIGLVKQLKQKKMIRMQQGMTINVRLQELEDKLHRAIDKNHQQELVYEERNERHIKSIEDHVDAIEEKIQEIRDVIRKEPTGQTLDVTFHTSHAAKIARVEAQVAQLKSKSSRVEEGFKLLLLASEKIASEHAAVNATYCDSQSRLESTANSIETMCINLRSAMDAGLRDAQENLASCVKKPQYDELRENILRLQEMSILNASEILKKSPDVNGLDSQLQDISSDLLKKLESKIDKEFSSLVGAMNCSSNQDEEKRPPKPALTTTSLYPRPQHCLSCMRYLPMTSRENLVEEVSPGVANNTNSRSFVVSESVPSDSRSQMHASDSVRYGTILDPPLHKVIDGVVDVGPPVKDNVLQQRTTAIEALRASNVSIWSSGSKERLPLKGGGSAFHASLDTWKVRVPSRGVPAINPMLSPPANRARSAHKPRSKG